MTLSSLTLLAVGFGAVVALTAPAPWLLLGWLPAALLYGLSWLLGR